MAQINSQFGQEDLFNEHTHNGQDSKRIPFENIEFSKRDAVSNPSGGATQDAEARIAIIAVIDRLESLGLIEEN